MQLLRKPDLHGMMECRMAEWQDGGIAEWRDGGMAEWRNGGIIFYYMPNLSCYIYGIRQQRRQHRRYQWLLNHLDVLISKKKIGTLITYTISTGLKVNLDSLHKNFLSCFFCVRHM